MELVTRGYIKHLLLSHYYPIIIPLLSHYYPIIILLLSHYYPIIIPLLSHYYPIIIYYYPYEIILNHPYLNTASHAKHGFPRTDGILAAVC